jgi:hypothetical protein
MKHTFQGTKHCVCLSVGGDPNNKIIPVGFDDTSQESFSQQADKGAIPHQHSWCRPSANGLISQLERQPPSMRLFTYQNEHECNREMKTHLFRSPLSRDFHKLAGRGLYSYSSFTARYLEGRDKVDLVTSINLALPVRLHLPLPKYIKVPQSTKGTAVAPSDQSSSEYAYISNISLLDCNTGFKNKVHIFPHVGTKPKHDQLFLKVLDQTWVYLCENIQLSNDSQEKQKAIQNQRICANPIDQGSLAGMSITDYFLPTNQVIPEQVVIVIQGTDTQVQLTRQNFVELYTDCHMVEWFSENPSITYLDTGYDRPPVLATHDNPCPVFRSKMHDCIKPALRYYTQVDIFQELMKFPSLGRHVTIPISKWTLNDPLKPNGMYNVGPAESILAYIISCHWYELGLLLLPGISGTTPSSKALLQQKKVEVAFILEHGKDHIFNRHKQKTQSYSATRTQLPDNFYAHWDNSAPESTNVHLHQMVKNLLVQHKVSSGSAELPDKEILILKKQILERMFTFEESDSGSFLVKATLPVEYQFVILSYWSSLGFDRHLMNNSEQPQVLARIAGSHSFDEFNELIQCKVTHAQQQVDDRQHATAGFHRDTLNNVDLDETNPLLMKNWQPEFLFRIDSQKVKGLNLMGSKMSLFDSYNRRNIRYGWGTSPF